MNRNKLKPEPGISEKDQADYVRTFNNPHGMRVLEILEKRLYSSIRLDTRPTDTRSNPAYMNPNAAFYRSAQLDVIQYIKRILKRNGVEVRAIDESEDTLEGA